MKWRLLIVTLLLAGIPVGASTPEELFDRGNTAYGDGRFAEAAEAYRQVLRYGVRDARVEYNLGNAEFRLGRLGPAILHFERARRLQPSDPDIQSNLEYAREFCVDQVQPSDRAAPIRWVQSLQDRVGPDLQAWIALLLVWVMAAILAFSLARPNGWRAASGWSLAGLALVLALTLASTYQTHQRLEGRRLAVVQAPSVDVLAGPGRNNAALFTVHEGLTLEVRAERDEWLQVGLPNGLNGWIERAALELV